VVVNPGKAAVETDIRLRKSASAARDAESDQPLPLDGKRLSGLTVGGHDFRLVIVEQASR
jgi:hypothetical protein